MDAIFVATAVMTVPPLIYAALKDLSIREISDIPWLAISSVGVLSAACTLIRDGDGVLPVLSAIAAFAIQVAVMYDHDHQCLWVLSFLPTVAAVAAADGTGTTLQAALSPVMVMACYLLYRVGAIPGGADAKCMMSLSVAFPVSFGPMLSGPADAVSAAAMFPPSVWILFSACVLTTVFGGAWILYKRRGLALPLSSSYRVSLEEALRTHVWVLEDVVNGAVARVAPSDEKDEVCGRLRSVGQSTVLVSPMFPFIVPIAAATVMMLVAGCPFIS